MSNVIRFLESMGSNAAMANMSIADYQAAVAVLEVGDEERTSLMSKNVQRLNDLHNGRHEMFCMVFAPEEKDSPDREEQEEGHEHPDEKPIEK